MAHTLCDMTNTWLASKMQVLQADNLAGEVLKCMGMGTGSMV